jgi:maltooligosyltrehalose trehalohydrolase
VVDAGAFRWTDNGWRGPPPEGQVLYEMHVGTFTAEGTWQAASRELARLAELGITMVELMPVADFPGAFGWGYDGVNWFAPSRLYGRPDDFRWFVDRAHEAGLAVILDVVYNHFGAVGNYLGVFSDHYKSRRHESEWGGAINFDGEGSSAVREYCRTNVRHWIAEYHLDGFRFDATQAIVDDSPVHVLTELAAEARREAGDRQLFLAAENEPQDVRIVLPAGKGGHGLDAMWNDDFHHAAMVRLTGRAEAYYSDYAGSPEEFIAAARHGFIYQGQVSRWQGRPRGTPTRDLRASAFITYLQNHDQVANSARGDRADKLTSPGQWRAMTVLWLLLPQTPLFFQGQEYGASTRFVYFADCWGDQARVVAEGRLKFLSQFPSLASGDARRTVPNPADWASFELSRLDDAERRDATGVWTLHRDLLKLRLAAPFCDQRRDRIDGAALGPDALVLRFHGTEGGDRLVVVNFGRDLALAPVPQPLLAPLEGMGWEVLLSTEDPSYGGCGRPVLEAEGGWNIPGESATVLQPAALSRDGGPEHD